MSTVRIVPQDAAECPRCGHRPAGEMSAQETARLESLILDKICSLDYVAKAGYSDDGREVTILVIHDDVADRTGEMIDDIGDGGTEIEDEIANRTVIPLAIHYGPDLPEGMLFGHKVVYTRKAGQRPRRQSGTGIGAGTAGVSATGSKRLDQAV